METLAAYAATLTDHDGRSRRIRWLTLRSGLCPSLRLSQRNHGLLPVKRVYRLHREEGLCVGKYKPRRHRSGTTRPERTAATELNESWSMDFMADQLFDGRRFRLLTLVDDFTRETLAIDIGPRFRVEDVVGVLDRVAFERSVLPEKIRVDNGTECASH